MKYYECHITMLLKPNTKIEKQHRGQWKFSQIDGDPVLGDGVKSYLTTFYPEHMTLEEIVDEMNYKAESIRGIYDAKILRTKVELVVYDERVYWTN